MFAIVLVLHHRVITAALMYSFNFILKTVLWTCFEPPQRRSHSSRVVTKVSREFFSVTCSVDRLVNSTCGWKNQERVSLGRVCLHLSRLIRGIGRRLNPTPAKNTFQSLFSEEVTLKFRIKVGKNHIWVQSDSLHLLQMQMAEYHAHVP